MKTLFISTVTVDDYVFSDNPRTFAAKDVIKQIDVDDAVHARLVKVTQEYFKVMEELREMVDPASQETAKPAGFVAAPALEPQEQPAPAQAAAPAEEARPLEQATGEAIQEAAAVPAPGVPWEDQAPLPPPDGVDMTDQAFEDEDLGPDDEDLRELEAEAERQHEQEAEQARILEELRATEQQNLAAEAAQDLVDVDEDDEEEEEEEEEEDAEEDEEDEEDAVEAGPPADGNEW